jgi:glutathione synthase
MRNSERIVLYGCKFLFFLFIRDSFEVALVYYRAGYTPNDYPGQDEWSARLKIEKSSAIKCPNVAYHIVGAKKVQQEIADKEVLSRFASLTND